MIDENNWSKFVSAHYGRPYRLQQQDGCMDRGTIVFKAPAEDEDSTYPDTVPEIVNHNQMCVNLKSWIARDPTQFLTQEERFPELQASSRDMWWQRNFYPPLSSIINDLHAKGLLPAGDYLIDIDW